MSVSPASWASESKALMTPKSASSQGKHKCFRSTFYEWASSTVEHCLVAGCLMS